MRHCLDDKSNFEGGQVANHLQAWRKISTDPWLLNSIQGIRIPFEDIPVQEREPYPLKLSQHEREFVDEELVRMKSKRIIEEVETCQGQVISNIFLRPKKDGGYRFILDLTWLNRFIQYEHFKMHSVNTALDMMREDCYMASIDLKDAYYSIPVCSEHCIYLRFRWQGRLYQFRVLPNGLACAPRFFTKILAPVFASLRDKGHECFPYIDDSFIVADTFEKCEGTAEELRRVLTELGFKIHIGKSILTPTKKLNFLGFLLDSEEFRVFLTQDKEDKLIRAAQGVLMQARPRIREVAGLIGLMIAFSPAFRYAEGYVKNLERDKIEALREARGDFEATMTPSREGKDEILWWLQFVRNSGKPVRVSHPDVVVFTDASNEGWGAHVGNNATGGRWTEQEKEQHINVLELRAVLFGLQSLCDQKDTHVRVMSDNTTALAYIKHLGGVKSQECNKVAREIWKWAEDKNIWISGAHIPGVDNVLADHKSRNFQDNLEWGLSQKIFDKITKIFRQPTIDLFATRLNCKSERYVSWLPDPQAIAIDAFSIAWTNEFFYAFPPFSMIAKAIEKIMDERAQGILIVPMWPTQPWWGRLVSLGFRRLNFRSRAKNLVPSGEPDNLHFLGRSQLAAFLFSTRH